MAVVKSTRAPRVSGKNRLINAALKLSMQTRSIRALGLRELAREAGLNPNTFYRHFRDLDELGVSIIGTLVEQIRQPLRDLRREAAGSVLGDDYDPGAADPMKATLRAQQVNRETIRLVFEFALQNEAAFLMGVQELHGASPVLRRALRAVMADFADDMVQDIKDLKLMVPLDEKRMHQLSEIVIRNIFQLSLEYIEFPEQRRAICQQAEYMVLSLLSGAMILNRMGPDLFP
ncbi:MAG: TetR family transcriptional regulator [Pseudomonadales bacterium]|uniref:TetR family transcriptional regulator n=1 Tax=Oleiphilus messinensis TaxID=141451 RepID=A0A1Y0I5T6_9GAMM|nr:TetR family transcriptional regulator [Oleiphilus messinensis]ARU55771.1 TetR family transcriptional regulator [Oleiphilus messinensis]MCG8613441.1 TetR family transcriptional regulator [Pseudomonadales bacterium]